MGGCRFVQRNLTAWVDEALSARAQVRVTEHLRRCPECAATAAAWRGMIAGQRQVLRTLSAGSAVDAERLHARVRGVLAAEPAGKVESFFDLPWLPRPLVIAGGAVLAGVALLLLFGGPAATLMALGIEAPPVAVARQTDLFTEYSVIQQLDALQHFDTVEAVQLDDHPGGLQPG